MAEQVKGMRVLVVHGDSDWVVPVELVWYTHFCTNWYGTHTLFALVWYTRVALVFDTNASTRVKRQYTNTVAVQLGHDIHSVVVEQAR